MNTEYKIFQNNNFNPIPAAICSIPISRLGRRRRIGIRQAFYNVESGVVRITLTVQ